MERQIEVDRHVAGYVGDGNTGFFGSKKEGHLTQSRK